MNALKKHAARVRFMKSPAVTRALTTRADAVAAQIRADDPGLHRHGAGFSTTCERCYQVLKDYDGSREAGA